MTRLVLLLFCALVSFCVVVLCLLGECGEVRFTIPPLCDANPFFLGYYGSDLSMVHININIIDGYTQNKTRSL